MLDSTPTVNIHRQGSCATFVVVTSRSVYAFDINAWNTSVRPVVGGRVLDSTAGDGVFDLAGDASRAEAIFSTAVGQPCSDCDGVHDIADLRQMFVGQPFRFTVGTVSRRTTIKTSPVQDVYFVR